MVKQNERYENPLQGEDVKYVYKGLECVFNIDVLNERGIDYENKSFRMGDFYFQPVGKLIKCRVLERKE